MLALTQHFLVQLSAHIAGKQYFSDYLVLGDDIVIARTPVKENYILLLKFLGVEVSIPKTVKPTSTIGIEFASKLFSNGREISPLPIGLVLEGDVLSLFSL